MDKVLEVVVVATIVIVIGAIMAYLVNDEASSFDEFVSDQRGESQEELDRVRAGCNEQESWSDCFNEDGCSPDAGIDEYTPSDCLAD